MPPPGLDHMSQPDPGSFIAVQTKPQNSAERHGDSAGQYDERTELLGGYNRHAESQRLPEDSSTKVPLTNRAKGQQKEQYRHPREDTGSGDKNKRVFSEEAERSSMYEMEEGNLRKRSSMSSSGSSELDREMLDSVFSKKSRLWGFLQHSVFSPQYRRRPCCAELTYCWFATAAIILILFIFIVLFQAYDGSQYQQPPSKVNLISNGSSLFAPTTILISLDGFRADYLARGLSPALNSFITEGVSPNWMLPSFPSVTFPNHYTLATGLYPESHGIVGNTFWDPEMEEEFYYTDEPVSMQPKWWGGEPLWVTAENQGVKTAVHMWPGSEAGIGGIEPAFLDKFNHDEPLGKKVDRVLEFLDFPGAEDTNISAKTRRPQLIAAYVPVIDSNGHQFGPNSTEINDEIRKVDKMLESIFAGLRERNLTDIVNVVVVSDHGMATTSTNRVIQLDDLIDMDMIEHTDGWPLYGLRLRDSKHLDELYSRLAQEASASTNFNVYLRDETMPQRFHFSHNDRIAPLWIVPKAGWAIVTRKDFDVKKAKENGEIYHPRGLHGYDHEHPLMRAIFVARGPAFPHVGGSRIDVFQNIEVYNIICDSLQIEPASNNGTLRLPFEPVGSHLDPHAPVEEVPDGP